MPAEATSGTPAGTEGTSGTTGTQAQPQTVPSGTQGTAPATGTQAPTTGTPEAARTGAATTGFTSKEDRSTWVPPHRIREESEKSRTIAAELETARRQIQALTGASPVSPDAAGQQEVREAFLKLYPHLKPLLELDEKAISRLIKSPDDAESAREFVNQGWAKHGKATLGNLVTAVTEAIGGEMSERAQGRLKSAFTEMIAHEVAISKRDNEPTATLQKYLDGDESLVEDFAKEWAEDYFVPARRQVASQEARRVNRQVPNSQGRTQQTQVTKPTEFKTIDERMDYAAKLAKERGMTFAND